MKLEKFFGYALSVLVALIASFACGGVLMAITAPIPGANEAKDGAEGKEGAEPQRGTHIQSEGIDGIVTDDLRKNADELIVDPIDRELVKMYQSGTPIDQITRQMKSVAINGMRYWYYSVDTRENVATTTANCTDLGDGLVGLLATDKNKIFDESDIIMLPDVPGYDLDGNLNPDTPLNLYVRKKVTNGLEVIAVNGNAGVGGGNNTVIPVAAITNGKKVVRLGHAASEGDILTANYAALPTKESNHMQIFKAQSLESTINAMSDHEVKWDKSDWDALMIGNLRQEIESTFIFGKKGYFWNEANQRHVYTTSGIVEQIVRGGHVIEYDPNTITEGDLIDIQRQIFVGNSGSNQRLIFAGSGFIATLAKMAGIARMGGLMEDERIFGMSWKKITSNFGQLNMIMHPLFDQIPGWADCAIIIDPQHLSKRVFRSMWRQVLSLKETGQFDGEGSVLTEISSVCLKYPKCHALLKPKA